jgi:hypothetical protein
MRYLSKIAAACVLALMSKVAVAMPMDYTFDVDFTTLELMGTSAQVAVTLVDVLGTGLETFRPSDGNLTAFNFVFNGVSFTVNDELEFPLRPEVTLVDGELSGIGYGGTVDGAFAGLTGEGLQGTNPFNDVQFVGSEKDGRGQIDVDSFARVPATVPAPATLALFGLGLTSLGWSRRKKT